MRHTKGSIVLSETQDHPILRQILACGFVTHDQLFRFMQLSLHERSRKSYNNRIRRLVKHNVVVEGYSPLVPGSRYYSIPTATAVILAGRGPLYVGAITGLEKRREIDALAHGIELNDIHLALAGSGRLIRWKPEVEIRAQNERTDFGHPKDYDAVVTLEGPAGEARFALEYERTPKREPQYVEIQRKLATETGCRLRALPGAKSLRTVANRQVVSKNRPDRGVRRGIGVLSGSFGYTCYRACIPVSCSSEQRAQMTGMRSFAVSMGPVCRFGPLLKSHWQRNLVWHYPSAFVVCSPLFVAVVVVDDLRCGYVNFCWQVGNGIGLRWNCGLRERVCQEDVNSVMLCER